MEETPKKKRLLASAYNLFTTKGLNATTIQDIVDAAKVAKGTFYLYFEDKYHLQEQLIINISEELFNNALNQNELSEQEWFDLFVAVSLLFRQGCGITYSGFKEIIDIEMLKNKFDLF